MVMVVKLKKLLRTPVPWKFPGMKYPLVAGAYAPSLPSDPLLNCANTYGVPAQSTVARVAMPQKDLGGRAPLMRRVSLGTTVASFSALRLNSAVLVWDFRIAGRTRVGDPRRVAHRNPGSVRDSNSLFSTRET